MKTILSFITGLLFLTQAAIGQKIVEKTISLEKDADITLDFQFADEIKISSWDKNEVYVKVTVNINENKDNDNFKLEVDDHGWFVEIKSEVEDLDDLSNQSITMSKKDGSDYVIRNGKGIQMELDFEVKVPGNNKLEVSTISGKIEAKDLLGELKLKSISGFLDISLPDDHNADIEMNTVTGGMYTDFTFGSDEEDNMRGFGNRKLSKKLNSGGTDIELETVSGDIYVRKSKK